MEYFSLLSLKVHICYIKASILYCFCNNSSDTIIMHVEQRLSVTSRYFIL